MRLNDEVSSGAALGVKAFEGFAGPQTKCSRRVVRAFVTRFPAEASALSRYYDATRPGLNYVLDRRFASAPTKVREALKFLRDPASAHQRRRRRARLHRTTMALLWAVAVLPMVLAPSHPIAVYGYLADVYGSSVVTDRAYAAESRSLSDFLTSYSQVKRYQEDLHEDMLATNTGKLFVVVRNPGGGLRQESIRTWNGFLPKGLPASVNSWLDRKEIPFLGDAVGLWLHGDAFEARGHYHSYGGGPSKGDLCAQRYSSLPEVVVSNGVIPMVYLEGRLIPYGHNIRYPERLLRKMRILEDALVVEGSNEPQRRSDVGERALLGYLKEYRGVNLEQTNRVAEAVAKLCAEFKRNNGDVFTHGYVVGPYEDNLDAYNFIDKLQTLHGWGNMTTLLGP